MQQWLLTFLCLLLLAATACQNQPPTQIVIVVTATPDQSAVETQIVLAATTTLNAGAAATVPPAATATITASVTPSHTSTPEPTPTTDPLPTPVVSQIQVAEQVFERGRMFWLQPVDQIWVMVVTREGGGEWSVYQDTFEEGQPETDPSIVPPNERLLQPMRGFGKLWRENPDVRAALGWAITPEFGYVTRYEYHRVAPDRPDGFHLLTSLYEEVFRFNEADGTWQLN